MASRSTWPGRRPRSAPTSRSIAVLGGPTGDILAGALVEERSRDHRRDHARGDPHLRLDRRGRRRRASPRCTSTPRRSRPRCGIGWRGGVGCCRTPIGLAVDLGRTAAGNCRPTPSPTLVRIGGRSRRTGCRRHPRSALPGGGAGRAGAGQDQPLRGRRPARGAARHRPPTAGRGRGRTESVAWSCSPTRTVGALALDGRVAYRASLPDVHGHYPVGSGDAFLGGLLTELDRGAAWSTACGRPSPPEPPTPWCPDPAASLADAVDRAAPSGQTSIQS